MSSRSAKNGVWITGVGTATPLGTTYRAAADALIAGRSGVRTIEKFDTSDQACHFAAYMDELPCPSSCRPDEFAQRDRFEQLALWCCLAALEDAGLAEREDLRIGLVLGIGCESLRNWEIDHRHGGRLIHEPHKEPAPLLHRVTHELGLTGPAMTVSTACASANHALGLARRWIRMGWCDVCLAGACDLSVTPMGLAAFGNLRTLSQRNDDPAAASRPFDRDRDGFVLGEGGGIFVLESAEHARARSAQSYAEIAGCGYSSDAHHIIIPRSDAVPVENAIRFALKNANVEPSEIDYINAHATSTPVGDAAEALAIRRVLGDDVSRVPVSSTKSITGHLITAASAIEAIACLAAIEQQAVPPTLNLDHPDDSCQLCHVPHVAQERLVKVAVSNAFGFGGSNSCVVFRAA